MNDTGKNAAGQLKHITQPIFWIFFLGVLAIGFFRYFELTQINSLIPLALLVVGYFIGITLMETHQIWLTWLIKKIPGTAAEDVVGIAALRSPILFLALPALGILLIASNSAAMGLGSFWGVWSWYALEAWAILHGNQALKSKYFASTAQQTLEHLQDSQMYNNVLIGFLLFGAAWGAVVAFL
jgi:hypothetical protein